MSEHSNIENVDVYFLTTIFYDHIIKIINNKNYYNGVFIVCMFYLFTTFARTTNRLQFT